MGNNLGDLGRLPKLSPCDEFDSVRMPARVRVPNRRVTRWPRVRFTLGQLVIAVALIAAAMGNAAWLAAVVMNITRGWRSRRRVERLGGNLLLRVVRPWLKRLETIALLLYPVILTASVADFALAMPVTAAVTPASYRVAVSSVLVCACIIGSSWPFFRWRRLEFHENGLVYESDFWPWDEVREWRWEDEGRTLRLIFPGRIVWCGIAQGDNEPVQAILEPRVRLVRTSP
jgi:hypothetical protein